MQNLVPELKFVEAKHEPAVLYLVRLRLGHHGSGNSLFAGNLAVKSGPVLSIPELDVSWIGRRQPDAPPRKNITR